MTDNTIHPSDKQGTVAIDNKCETLIKLNSAYQVSGVNKILSVANTIDSGMCVLFDSKDVKFFWTVEVIKADVIHTGLWVDDMYVISTWSKKQLPQIRFMGKVEVESSRIWPWNSRWYGTSEFKIDKIDY